MIFVAPETSKTERTLQATYDVWVEMLPKLATHLRIPVKNQLREDADPATVFRITLPRAFANEVLTAANQTR